MILIYYLCWCLCIGRAPAPAIHAMQIVITRRSALVTAASGCSAVVVVGGGGGIPVITHAYAPDLDRIRESLYLISRAKEATVQQERLVNKTGLSEGELQKKMRLSVKLVDRSYRLLDQITYCSQFVDPPDQLIPATAAGNEAVDALQSAIY
jgi:hypothetical protein